MTAAKQAVSKQAKTNQLNEKQSNNPVRKILTSNYLWIILYAIVMSLSPLAFGNDYYIKILIMVAINTIMVLGLNLLMGYAGQVSIGHAAFFGVGAYASAIATTKYGMSPWIGIAASIIVGAIVACAIAIPTLRLKGHYLAMATLGFAEILQVLFREMSDYTGGTDGLVGIPAISIGSYILDTNLKLFEFVLAVLVFCLIISINIARSRVGRALRAVHGSEIAASATGINISLYKVQVFVLSAIMACISGSLYAHMAGFVSPDSFTLGLSITLVTMAVFGGMTNVWGAILGATSLTLLHEYLTGYEDYNLVIFGTILVLAMVFMPKGIIGLAQSAYAFIAHRKPKPADNLDSLDEVAGEANAAS